MELPIYIYICIEITKEVLPVCCSVAHVNFYKYRYEDLVVHQIKSHGPYFPSPFDNALISQR